MKLQALALLAALFAPYTAAAAPDAGCDFEAPAPLLGIHAYPGQTFALKTYNTAVETVSLDGDVRLQINTSQCLGSIQHEFVFTLPPNRKHPRDVKGWLDFARSELHGLKVYDPGVTAGLVDFLKRASALTPKNGIIALCQRGAIARGGCDLGLGPAYRFELRQTATAVRLSVQEDVRGCIEPLPCKD